jgi:hypothetical protein
LFTTQNRQQFPPLRNMLRQMIGEEVAAGVLPIVAERRKIAAGELTVSVGE